MIKNLLVASLMIGSPVVAMAAQFPDVAPDHWAYQAILNLKDRYGCVAGYPSGNFLPNRAASRSEMAALVNHCLDNISSYVDDQDKALAEKLRSEFAPEIAALNNRLTALEVKEQRKQYGVGPYVGVGITAGNAVTDNIYRNGVFDVDSSEDTAVGVGIQARFPVFKALGGEFSVRPYTAFNDGPRDGFLFNGGATATYDFPIARRTLADGTTVSTANLYTGVGYGTSRYYGVNYRDKVNGRLNNQDDVIFVVGAEASISRNFVVFGDVKLPASKNNQTDSYDAQGIVGVGFKF